MRKILRSSRRTRNRAVNRFESFIIDEKSANKYCLLWKDGGDYFSQDLREHNRVARNVLQLLTTLWPKKLGLNVKSYLQASGELVEGNF